MCEKFSSKCFRDPSENFQVLKNLKGQEKDYLILRSLSNT